MSTTKIKGEYGDPPLSKYMIRKQSSGRWRAWSDDHAFSAYSWQAAMFWVTGQWP